MKPWMLSALVIICFIILIYMISKKEKLANVFSDAYDSMVHTVTCSYDKTTGLPEKLYNNMVGYEKSENMNNASAKLKKKEKLYQSHEQRGNLSRNQQNAAATNSFILGDIYRFSEMENAENEIERDRAREMAGEYYNRTLMRINARPVDTVIGNEIGDGPTVDMMIDRADEFYQINNDLPTNIEIDFNNLRDTVRAARVMAFLGGANDGNNNTATVMNNTPKRKRVPRKHNQTTKQYAQERFYEPKNIRSDPQNVHETQVSGDLERIYTNIKFENDKDDMITGGVDNRQGVSIEDIRNAINAHKFSKEDERRRALTVLDTMNNGGEITKLHDNERNVLLNVWKRIHSSDNDNRRDNLRASLIDSLASGMEKNYYGDYAMVCANGRCGRVINSLTLLDANKDISRPIKTKEIMKNEVFSKSYKILENELKKAPADVVKAYNGTTPESQINAELTKRVDDFMDNVKSKIETQIRADYDGSTNDATLENLIKDAQSGV